MKNRTFKTILGLLASIPLMPACKGSSDSVELRDVETIVSHTTCAVNLHIRLAIGRTSVWSGSLTGPNGEVDMGAANSHDAEPGFVDLYSLSKLGQGMYSFNARAPGIGIAEKKIAVTPQDCSLGKKSISLSLKPANPRNEKALYFGFSFYGNKCPLDYKEAGGWSNADGSSGISCSKAFTSDEYQIRGGVYYLTLRLPETIGCPLESQSGSLSSAEAVLFCQVSWTSNNRAPTTPAEEEMSIDVSASSESGVEHSVSSMSDEWSNAEVNPGQGDVASY